MLAGVKTDCKLVDAELDRRFNGGAPGIPPQAQKHLDQCERCRTLYSHLTEALPPGSVRPEVEHRIVKTIQASLKPVSRLQLDLDDRHSARGGVLFDRCGRNQHDEGCRY